MSQHSVGNTGCAQSYHCRCSLSGRVHREIFSLSRAEDIVDFMFLATLLIKEESNVSCIEIRNALIYNYLLTYVSKKKKGKVKGEYLCSYT